MIDDKMLFNVASFLPETVFITDANGTVIFLNQVGENIFGVSPVSESEKILPERFFISEERSRLKNSLSKCQKGKYECIQEVTALKHDGSNFTVQVHMHPIFENNHCNGLVGFIIDISSKEASLNELLTTDQKVQTILDNSKEYWGWILCDFQGNFIDASIDQFKEFKISKEDLVGLNICDFLGEEEGEGALQFLQTVKQEGMASGIQHIKLATGEERSYEYKNIAIYENDEPVAVRITVRDITEKLKGKPAIEAKETRYQGVFENTGLPTAIIEENLLISMVNAKFEELTGYARNEIEEKMSLSQFFEDETIERVRKQSLGQPADASSEYECRITSRSGKAYDMIIRFGNISSTRQMIVSLTDITSRKQTEEEIKKSSKHLQAEHIKDKKALKKSEERYQMIIENVEDLVFEQDLAGSFTFVNAALIKRFGSSKAELIGMNYRAFTVPEEKQMVKKYYNEIYKTGEHRSKLHQTIIRKDGSTFYVDVTSSLIKNRDGNPIGFRGIARDITERRRAEKILKEREQQLKEIIEGSPIATIVFDKNHQITHWNKACEELTGIKADDVVGNTKKVAEKLLNQPILPDLLVDHDSLEEISEFYGWECRKSKIIKNAYEIELFFPNLGAKGKWVCLTMAFLRDPENSIIGVIETLLDVTSQKRAAKNLLKIHDALEEKVAERTGEIQEVNIALEVLLKKRENDKQKFEDKVAYSIKEVLIPHIELLKKTSLDKHQKVYLEILEDNFKEIASPFMSRLSDNIQKLTRTEIQVVNLIRQNKITKEIADLMGVSTRTIETHRDNIRKKFGLKNKKINLRSFLLTSE